MNSNFLYSSHYGKLEKHHSLNSVRCNCGNISYVCFRSPKQVVHWEWFACVQDLCLEGKKFLFKDRGVWQEWVNLIKGKFKYDRCLSCSCVYGSCLFQEERSVIHDWASQESFQNKLFAFEVSLNRDYAMLRIFGLKVKSHVNNLAWNEDLRRHL